MLNKLREKEIVMPNGMPTGWDMLRFRTLINRSGINKGIFVSAGSPEDKMRILPAIQQLAAVHNVTIYATEGTSAFLTSRNVKNTCVARISERRPPNARSLLSAGNVDLVVNILTGDQSYDEQSDSDVIRSLAVENLIPLITDARVAVATILKLISEDPQTTAVEEPWNMHRFFLSCAGEYGGLANSHAHLDKAYLISHRFLEVGQIPMQQKWAYYRKLKQDYTHEDLVTRITRGAQAMITQGVTHLRTMVDADSIVGLRPILAALEVKQALEDQIVIEIGIQPLEGVLEPNVRKIYEQACEMADFLGGLPSRDRPYPQEHLDVVMEIAKRLGKPLDVHVDQANDPTEDETEQLARSTITHGLEGRVAAIHAISLACKPIWKRREVIRLLKDAGVTVVVCPSAALSMKPVESMTLIHNSIAPVEELLEAGVEITMGTDNIADPFMPVVDGDMWTEARFLMEACRFYNVREVARMACNKSLFVRQAA